MKPASWGVALGLALVGITYLYLNLEERWLWADHGRRATLRLRHANAADPNWWERKAASNALN